MGWGLSCPCGDAVEVGDALHTLPSNLLVFSFVCLSVCVGGARVHVSVSSGSCFRNASLAQSSLESG